MKVHTIIDTNGLGTVRKTCLNITTHTHTYTFTQSGSISDRSLKWNKWSKLVTELFIFWIINRDEICMRNHASFQSSVESSRNDQRKSPISKNHSIERPNKFIVFFIFIFILNFGTLWIWQKKIYEKNNNTWYTPQNTAFSMDINGKVSTNGRTNKHK